MSFSCVKTWVKYQVNASFQISSILKNKSPLHPQHVISCHNFCNGALPRKKTSPRPNENNFSHKVLENIPAYKMTIFNASKHFLDNTPTIKSSLEYSPNLDINISELFAILESILYSNHQDSDIFEIFDAVRIRCHEMNDDQLALILKHLNYSLVFRNEKKKKLLDLWLEIDKACVVRWKSWSIDKVFYFLDLWYTLDLLKKSKFVFQSTLKFLNKPERLSPQQVVQLLFYLNMLRFIPKNVPMFNLECRLEKCIEELSIEEIGVAVMGFFKTENLLKGDKIINHAIDKTVAEIKTVPEITLACILKATRHCIKIPLWNRIPELLNVIEKELPRLTIQCSVHASLLLTRGPILHEGILIKVSQKLIDNISTCRLKDIEKAVYPVALLNYNPKTEPCYFQTILTELSREERRDEISYFPKTFVALVHYLCLKGVFAENLIQKVLDMEFIEATYGKNKFNFGRELLCIDATVGLEFSSYTGPRLPMDVRNYLSRRYSEYIPDLITTKKMTKHQKWHLHVKDIAETVFGKEYLIEKYLLPNHPRADIIVNLDNEKKALAIDEGLKNTEDFTGPITPPKGSNYHVLIVGSKNMFLYRSAIPNGDTVSKLKQLRLLGYTPILVNCGEIPIEGTLEKAQYLKNLISSAT